MSTDDVDDAMESILSTGSLDGAAVDPEFRDLLCRVAKGELSVDEAMKIARSQRDR